ncbi:MAG: hypothetical protein KBT39_04420 [Bacteroidales bacterium]|nr:hypothetical protein [Bacteroidales bacterium]
MRKIICLLIILIVSSAVRAEKVEFNGVSIKFDIPGVTITSKDIETYERPHHIPSYLKDEAIIQQIKSRYTVKILKLKGTCRNGKFVVKGTATRPYTEIQWAPGQTKTDTWMFSCVLSTTTKLTPRGDEAVDNEPGEVNEDFWKNFKEETLSYDFEVPGNSEVSSKHNVVQLRMKVLDPQGWVVVFGEFENLDYGAAVTVEAEGSEITTEDKQKMESGDVDSEGLSGWEVPATVAIVVMGVGAATAFTGKNEEDGDVEEEEDEDEPQDENPNLAWRMMKEFGDQIFVGDQPKTIAAKIVQVKDTGDVPMDHLTRLIQISSPDNFEVSNVRMINGGFMAADIQVRPGLNPQQVERGGHVNFTLAANGASNTYSMRFDIVIPTFEIEPMDVILGDGRTYQTLIKLNAIVNPKEVCVESTPNYEVVEQPVPTDDDSGANGCYTLQILNKTKKPETNVLESTSHQYDPVKVTVKAVFEGDFVVTGELLITEYPEGMYFVVKKVTNGYADVQTDNARDKVIFGMTTVVRIPTDVRVNYAKYDEDQQKVVNSRVKQLKAAGDIKGQGEYETGLARDFSFKIEDMSGTYDFTPLTTLAMKSKDKPYMAELPLKGVVEYEEYGEEYVEGNLTMALYGLVPYKRTDWDKECDRLLKIITMFELQDDANVRRTWESRKFYSANEINLFSRALLEEAVQYHTMQSEKYNTQAAWLSCGLACCHLLSYAGDQAAEIVLTYYFGPTLGKCIASPFAQLLKKLAVELTNRYAEGEQLLPTDDDKEAAWNTLFTICNTLITEEVTGFVSNPKDMRKLGGLIAVFLTLNTAKHYWFDDDKSNRYDFWLAVMNSCADVFKESAKQAIGKVLGDKLKQLGKGSMENLSKWFGEKMSADKELCDLVIGKLEDVFKNNPAQNVIPTLYDAMISDKKKNAEFFTELIFKLLVPDKDDDTSVENYWLAIKALITAATHTFEKVLNHAAIDTQPRIARKRRENEAYS